MSLRIPHAVFLLLAAASLPASGSEPSVYTEYDQAMQERPAQPPPPSITFETAVARSKARRSVGRDSRHLIRGSSGELEANIGGINIPPGATLNAREIILMPRIGDVTVLPGPRRP
jgi:hypothetical protein